MKLADAFTDEERAVIRERRRYQPAAELAAVFGTSTNVIAAICRPTLADAGERAAALDGF